MTIGELVRHLQTLDEFRDEHERLANNPPVRYRNNLTLEQLNAMDNWDANLERISREIEKIEELNIT